MFFSKITSGGTYKEAAGKILNETNGIWTVEMKPGETLKIN